MPLTPALSPQAGRGSCDRGAGAGAMPARVQRRRGPQRSLSPERGEGGGVGRDYRVCAADALPPACANAMSRVIALRATSREKCVRMLSRPAAASRFHSASSR